MKTRTPALVNYHVHSEAPQAFHFEVDGIFGNMASPDLVATKVGVRDLRGAEDALRIETDGILFTRHSPRGGPTTGVGAFGQTEAWQGDYEVELRALLTQCLGAEEVIVFDHTVRLDERDAGRQPARNVHNDYSRTGAEQRLVDLVGERAPEFLAGHYAFVNVWRPIENVRSSPLGFVHPSSIDDDDWVTIDLVYPDRRGQILGLVANAEHDWVYLSGMQADEVAVFNVYDSAGRPVLGHSALDIVGDRGECGARKSIESRTLVRYR